MWAYQPAFCHSFLLSDLSIKFLYCNSFDIIKIPSVTSDSVLFEFCLLFVSAFAIEFIAERMRNYEKREEKQSQSVKRNSWENEMSHMYINKTREREHTIVWKSGKEN